jgi:hypothetical protein
VNRSLIDYFRCPDQLVNLRVEPELSRDAGFFRFGSGATGYGHVSGVSPSWASSNGLSDVLPNLHSVGKPLCLSFDPDEIVDNLRLERYLANQNGLRSLPKRALRGSYYHLRPLLPTFLRRGIQRMYYADWSRIPFPSWPVDCSADRILQGVLWLLLQNEPEGIPFIWFWPEGLPSCAMMTHDIEEVEGRDFCGKLMDLNDAYGIKTSFQVVPEERYPVPATFLEGIRSRGFEINIHDVNHDGSLFHDEETFYRGAKKINQYAREFGALGFRAGSMYRHPDWYHALDVSYDMSIPTVAHMEPQRGGCCTVMPYFIGRVLELPLTTTQDFALFNVLREKTCDLWRREIELVSAQHGLISFIVHPDYLLSVKAQEVYAELLSYLSELGREGRTWLALPREVNDWWRQRTEMRLIRRGQEWIVEGSGSERARVAWARLVNGQLAYCVEGSQVDVSSTCRFP